MLEVIAYCVTALLSSLIIAGGINRAAAYTSYAILSYLKDRDKHSQHPQGLSPGRKDEVQPIQPQQNPDR